MNDFEKMVIGLPDTKKEQAIVKIYSEICKNASLLLWDIEFYLECPDKLDLPVFFDFLNEKHPKDWLYLRYIEYHGLSFPGISIAKIIEFGMVDVPVDKFDNLVKSRNELLSLVQQAKELNFYYPLSNLFDSTEDNRGFAITNQSWGFDSNQEDQREYLHETKDFDKKLYEHVRKFTKSAHENEVLQTIEKAIESLNELVLLGIIRNSRQQWKVDLENLVSVIVFNLNEEMPLSIHPNLPKFKGFGKHFEERGWNHLQGKPEDILKFEELASDQFEEYPEELLQSEDHEFKDGIEIKEDMLQNGDTGAEHAEANTEEVLQIE